MIAYANYFTDARIKNYVETLLQSGYQVDVFALGVPEPPRDGLRVFCLMPKVWSQSILPYVLSQLCFLLLATFLVGARHLRRRYELIHVHNMPDFLVFAALMPKILGTRVILDIHDTMPEAYATKFDLPLDHLLIRLIRLEERVSAALADHVITTNDLHKEALVGHGIPSEKITIIMNVANEKVFRPRSDASQQTTGLTIAYHGTVARRLGIDLILEAIHQIQPACPNLHFLLIGDGDGMPTVHRLIKEYGLERVVETRGWVPVEKLPDHLSGVDLGVVGNRRYTEARQNWMLPVKMLEYAAMEIPTAAPRLRVIQQYFDETNSLLYEPDSAVDLARCLLEAYQHREKLQPLKEGLRAFNKRFNWSMMEKEYLSLLRRLE